MLFLLLLFLPPSSWAQYQRVNEAPKGFNNFFESQDRLSNLLFSNYNSLISPIYTLHGLMTFNSSQLPDNPKPFPISLELYYLKLADVSEPQEKVELIVEIVITWNEPRLSWEPEDFAHIEWVYLNEDGIWIPPIIAYGAHQVQDFREGSQRIATLWHDGQVSSYMSIKVATVCSMNVDAFPFDVQKCRVRLVCPYFYYFEIKLRTKIFGGINESSVIHSMGNSEWNITELKTSVELQAYSDSDGTTEIAVFEVTMKRNAGYYVYMIIVPTYIINGAALVGIFLTDADRMSRLTVGLSTIMTLTFILGILADKIPKTRRVPMLGMYIIINLSITLASVLLATWLPPMSHFLRSRFLDPKQSKTSSRVLRFVLKEKTLLRCSLLVMETVNSIAFIVLIGLRI